VTAEAPPPPPSDAEAWSVDDDLQVFRRVKKVLAGVPDHAYPRVRSYLEHMLREREPFRMVGAIPGASR
jgi:hypothetical protein